MARQFRLYVLMINLKLACRTLFKTPFVTIVAIVSLALGIGANAAIFSLFNQMLLRPLPVPEPVRLVNLGSPGPRQGSTSCSNAGDCDFVFSYPMFRDLERAQTVFTGLAAHVLFGANLSFGGQTLSGEGELVSGSYFPVLGVQPALGRLLGPQDDQTVGESHVVVLSHAYWQTRFAASPAVLDAKMIVNGQPMTIVGVAPRGFDGTTLGSKPEVFVPITLRGLMQPNFKGFDDRKSYWAYLFARLKPGVSIEQARAAINVPYRALINDVDAPLQKMSEQTLARFKAKQITLEDGSRGQSTVAGEAKAPLTLLLGVTALVLLIACANIANLLRRARRRARGRDGDPAVPRREPLAARRAAAHGVVRARAARRRRRPARRAVDAATDRIAPARRGGDDDCPADRPAGADLRRRADDRDRAALRAVSRAAQHPARSRLRAQGSGRPAVRHPDGGAVPRLARHDPDCAVDGAARVGRVVHEEPDQRQPRRISG